MSVSLSLVNKQNKSIDRNIDIGWYLAKATQAALNRVASSWWKENFSLANCVDVGHEKEVLGEQSPSSGGGSNWSVVAGFERKNNLGQIMIFYFALVYLRISLALNVFLPKLKQLSLERSVQCAMMIDDQMHR